MLRLMSAPVAATFVCHPMPVCLLFICMYDSRLYRPIDVETVHPSKVKQRGLVGMIHSIVHAESYAIDLSWCVYPQHTHTTE